jgi:iron-sulfur cluster assembly accessory protein
VKVKLTLRAATYLADLCSGDQDTFCLVIQVRGGGCSGLTYAFGSKNKPDPNDVVLYDMDFVKVLSDKISAVYLDGSTIDYENLGLNGSGIKITNPNADHYCGCGISFSPKNP